jgi:hypothetical protein
LGGKQLRWAQLFCIFWFWDLSLTLVTWQAALGATRESKYRILLIFWKKLVFGDIDLDSDLF